MKEQPPQSCTLKSKPKYRSEPLIRNNNDANKNSNNINKPDKENILTSNKCNPKIYNKCSTKFELVKDFQKLNLNTSKENVIKFPENVESVKPALNNENNIVTLRQKSELVKEKDEVVLVVETCQESDPKDTNSQVECKDEASSIKATDKSSEDNKHVDEPSEERCVSDSVTGDDEAEVITPDDDGVTSGNDKCEVETIADGSAEKEKLEEDELLSRSPDKVLQGRKEEKRYAPYRDEISRIHQSGGSIFVSEQLQLSTMPVSGSQSSFNVIHDDSEPEGSPPPILVAVEEDVQAKTIPSDLDILTSVGDSAFRQEFCERLLKGSGDLGPQSPSDLIPTLVDKPAPTEDNHSRHVSPLPGVGYPAVTNFNFQISPPSSVQEHEGRYPPSPLSSYDSGSQQASPLNNFGLQMSPGTSPVGSPQVVPTWRHQNSIPSNSSSSPSRQSYPSSPSLCSSGGWGDNRLTELEDHLTNLGCMGELIPPQSPPYYADFEPIDTSSIQSHMITIPGNIVGECPNNLAGNSTNPLFQLEEVSMYAPLGQNARLSPSPMNSTTIGTPPQLDDLIISWRDDIETLQPLVPNPAVDVPIPWMDSMSMARQNEPQVPVQDFTFTQQRQPQRHQPQQQQTVPAKPIFINVPLLIQVPAQSRQRRILPGPPVPRSVPWSAKERLKKRLVDDAKRQQYRAQVFAFAEDEIAFGDKEHGDTQLMIAVCNWDKIRDPLYVVYALVERLRKIPGSLQIRNHQGYSALYTASLCLPQEPLIARYIAETLLELGINVAEEMYEGGNSLPHCVSCKGDSHSQVLVELLSIRDAAGKEVFNLNRPNDHSGNS